MTKKAKRASGKKGRGPNTKKPKIPFWKNRKWLRTRLLPCAAAVLLLTAGIVSFVLLRGAGVFLRGKTVAKTDHYTVDGAMYSYFFYSSLYTELSGSSAAIYEGTGVTEDANLKKLSYGEGKSWFDFFDEVASTRLTQILRYAEAAADGGVTLDEANEASIQAKIDELRGQAAGVGQSFDRYLAGRFGVGVKEKDVRAFLTLLELASKQTEVAKGAITVSPAEIDALRADLTYSNASLFYYVSEARLTASMSEAEKARAKEEARKNAERLVDLGDPQSFINEVRRQEEQRYAAQNKTLTEEEFADIQADFSYYGIPYASAKLIDAQIEQHKAGDSFLLPDETAGSYGAVLILEGLHTDETPSYNYHLVSFSKKADTEAFQALLDSSAAKTEEEAVALALQSGGRDAGSFENEEGEDLAQELLAWLSEEGRSEGDGKIWWDESGNKGWFLYYRGKGLTAFERRATNLLLSKKYEEIDGQYAERYAAVTVKENSGKAVATRKK